MGVSLPASTQLPARSPACTLAGQTGTDWASVWIWPFGSEKLASNNKDCACVNAGNEATFKRPPPCASNTSDCLSRKRDCLPMSASSGEATARSEEHTSELQSLMRISYAVFCLKKQTKSPA